MQNSSASSVDHPSAMHSSGLYLFHGAKLLYVVNKVNNEMQGHIKKCWWQMDLELS
jgi:hypothetical protein